MGSIGFYKLKSDKNGADIMPIKYDKLFAIMKEKGLIEGRGGARKNSGPEGNGFSQAANVSRTNERNALNSKTTDSKIVEGAKSGGGS